MSEPVKVALLKKFRVKMRSWEIVEMVSFSYTNHLTIIATTTICRDKISSLCISTHFLDKC